MQRLNAIDAIGPAWDHTHRLLFSPPRWTTLLKVGAVAVLAQMGGCNSSFASPGNPLHTSSANFNAALFGVLLALGLIVLIVALAFFYLSSRFQFVLFDLVLRRDTRIGPIWRRYGGVVWHWIGLKLLFILTVAICMLPIILPVVFHFIHTIPATGSSATVDPMSMMAMMFEFIAAILVVALLVGVAYVLLLDFALPSLALEDTTLGETLRRIVLLVRQEPGQIALFILMRFLLGLAWGLGAAMALLFFALILLVPLGGAALILWAALQHSGIGGHAFMICGWILLGGVFFLAMLFAYLIAFGYGFAFLKAYAIYFLAGRYPLMASILEPTPGAPFTPPPVFPSAEERKDSDGGPPMPMNPAIA